MMETMQAASFSHEAEAEPRRASARVFGDCSRNAMMRLAWSIALLVCACARGSGGPDEFDSYYQRLARLEAQYQICATGIAPEFAGDFVRMCENGGSGFDPVAEAAQARTEVSAGHAAFDASRAVKCLDALQIDPTRCWGPTARFVDPYSTPMSAPVFVLLSPPSTASALGQEIPDDCSHVFNGLLPDGASCVDWRECTSGICIYDSSGGQICYHAALEGEQCDGDHACAVGLVCLGAGSTPSCYHLGHAGDPCADFNHCERGLACVNGACAKADAGQACGWIRSVDCREGLLCNGTWPWTCEQPPKESCAASPFFPACAGNQICFGSSGQATCGTPQDVGGPCIVGLQGIAAGCYAGLLCDSTTAKCILPPPEPGEPCIDGACNPFTAFCSNGTCKAQVDDGQPCTAGVDVCHPARWCFSGICATDPDGDGICEIDIRHAY